MQVSTVTQKERFKYPMSINNSTESKHTTYCARKMRSCITETVPAPKYVHYLKKVRIETIYIYSTVKKTSYHLPQQNFALNFPKFIDRSRKITDTVLLTNDVIYPG